MSFGWAYPPGVTGSEFAIAGPDREWEEDRWCDRCDRERAGTVQTYGDEAWFICATCETQRDIGVRPEGVDDATEQGVLT